MNPHGGAPASRDGSAPKACPSCGARYAADALFCSLDGAPLTTSPGAIAAAAANDYYVGREILGHIEIRQLVGLGAMGRVYRAFQRGIDRDVAVKILHRELSANEAVVARFNREAKVAARLSHPNVVHVLLVGQLPDGAMYIVMEYLDGMSLQSALAAAGGALPLPRALHIALQLCDAAGEAHAQGVVHRDLKPENIMLIRRADDPDFVKVLDFGIARVSWGDPSMATAAGLIFGTSRYISPEGASGEKVGPQGDVYSIATMVYQMASGRTPFEGDQAVSLLLQQIHDAPAPLKSLPRAAHMPDPIAGAVMRNLSKRPEDRAENARAFGRALLEAAVASGVDAQDILARPSLLPSAREREMTPVVRTEIADPTTAPPGVATAKWVPPAAVRTALVTPPAPSRPASTVDATLADQPPPPGLAPVRPSGRVWTGGLLALAVLTLLAAALQHRGAGTTRDDPRAAPTATPAGSAKATALAAVPVAPAEPSAAPGPAVPPLVGLASPSPAAAGPSGPVRVSVETSSARPGVGQPVDLAARLAGGSGGPSGHPRVEGARFRIAGPGIGPGTELSAFDDGSSVLRTTFTFLQPGRFEVTFVARADGTAVRSTRIVVVEDPSAPAPAPAPAPAAGPAPAPTAPPAKWM